MWTLALGLLLAAAEPDPYPGIPDPLAFVTEVYAAYDRPPAYGPALDPVISSRLRVHLYAQGEAEGGQELINHDWWVNGRDFENPRVSHVVVRELPGQPPDRRQIAVSLRNHGRPSALRFHFLREGGAWRLDEVVGEAGGRRWSLTGLLARRPTAPPNL